MRVRCQLTALVMLFVFAGMAVGQDAVAPQPTPTDETTVQDATAQETAPQDDESTAEIEAAIQTYVAAFNSRDAEAAATHWSPECVYTNRQSGEQFRGRDAIKNELTRFFADEDSPTLAFSTESIEFISPNVALERGTAIVTQGSEPPKHSAYTTVFLRRGDKWLIDRVIEDETEEQPSNREHLGELEWLIGEWVDDFGDGTIELNCQWTQNETYIYRTYKVITADEVTSSGLQIIGWDPSQKKIRSWLFDSEGGFVAGEWTQTDSTWTVQSLATLSDGTSGSFTSVFRPQDDGTYRWRKINRVVDGRLLPNLDEVVVTRK